MQPEGRAVREDDGRYLYEYVLSDHLGNARIRFADTDRNGYVDRRTATSDVTEVLQETHYYPFGMKQEGPWESTVAPNQRYQYNGIEHLEELGLNVNFATFRTLDASIGRWWQMDPMAEGLSDLSPYNSMANNPIRNIDPEGDFFFAIPSISFGSNGLSVGLEAGVGIPGIGALSANVGYNFKHKQTSWGVQAAMGFAYAGYGSNGAYMGVGFNHGGFNVGATLNDDFGWSVGAGYGVGGASGGISYGSGGFGWSAGYSYQYQYARPEPMRQLNNVGGVQGGDILPDGRYLWELSYEEFVLFHSSEGREYLFGGAYDIQLNIAERAYYFGKALSFATPTGRLLTKAPLYTFSNSKAINSNAKQILIHKKKLQEYIANPYKFDNKGFLKNAPNDQIRQNIINGRINHLNTEIRTFQNNINKLMLPSKWI